MNGFRSRPHEAPARPAGFSDGSDSDEDDFDISGPSLSASRSHKNNPNRGYVPNNQNQSYQNGFNDDWETENKDYDYDYTIPQKPEELIRIACCEGDLESVTKYFKENPTKINFCMDNLTYLMYAAKNSQIDIVAYLLSIGADVNIHKKNKNTALMYAITSTKGSESQVLDIVKMLIDHGAKINVQDSYGYTPLCLAVKESLETIVKYLLEQGANPNILDGKGQTCLFYAAEQGRGKIVRCLLEHKADPSIVAENGWTAVEVAGDKNYFKVSELIQLVRDTKWEPGLHTSSMKEIDEEASAKRREKFQNSIGSREDQYLENILTSINAPHYIQVFKTHKITYLQFLQMDDERLEKIGISEVGTREKLLGAIADMRNEAWQQSSIPQLPSKRKVGMAEAVCMINNINHHLQHMAAAFETLKKAIDKDPQALQLGSERNKIQDVIKQCKSTENSCNNMCAATKAVTESFLRLEGSVHCLPGDEVRRNKKAQSRLAIFSLVVCTLGLGGGILWILRK